jgi:DNA-binding transcriptional LysR family regulator
MSMLDLRQLSYFVAVAEEEHVGRAATRLHISQSPLSRQIAGLEDRLGLRLFERIHRRIRLTHEGRAFLTQARQVLAQAQALEALGRSLGDKPAPWARPGPPVTDHAGTSPDERIALAPDPAQIA